MATAVSVKTKRREAKAKRMVVPFGLLVSAPDSSNEPPRRETVAVALNFSAALSTLLSVPHIGSEPKVLRPL